MKKNDNMRVLLIDIETAPATARVWGLRDKYINPDRIVSRGRTLCFSSRWEGESLIEFQAEWGNGHLPMVERAWQLIDEADVVIHYNGKKFDMPTLNREFVLSGLVPPTPYKQIDLYQVVRTNFRFISNKMDEVANELGLSRKTPHKGYALWEEVMAGDPEALRTMEKYNIQDVAVLGELYEVLLPWIKAHPNRGLYVGDQENPVCPSCGSEKVQKRGIERPARVNAYQRYKCMACGANSRGRLVVQKAPEALLV